MPQAIINSKGVSIDINVGIDLTAATTLDIRWTKPDGSTVGKWQIGDGVAAVLVGTDWKVRFTTNAITNIDTVGNWSFQVYAIGAGYELYGTKVKYKFTEKMLGSF